MATYDSQGISASGVVAGIVTSYTEQTCLKSNEPAI